jgi:flagellar basal body-associated protein FliL
MIGVMSDRSPFHRLPRLIAALMLAGVLACPLAAAAEEGEGQNPTGADPRGVAIPVIIAPVVDGDRLVGYLYLGLKLVTDADSAADRMRDDLPLLQDRILRAFNNAPIPAAEAGTEEAKAALIKTATTALTGLREAEGVRQVEVTDIQNVPF